MNAPNYVMMLLLLYIAPLVLGGYVFLYRKHEEKYSFPMALAITAALFVPALNILVTFMLVIDYWGKPWGRSGGRF